MACGLLLDSCSAHAAATRNKLPPEVLGKWCMIVADETDAPAVVALNLGVPWTESHLPKGKNEDCGDRIFEVTRSVKLTCTCRPRALLLANGPPPAPADKVSGKRKGRR